MSKNYAEQKLIEALRLNPNSRAKAAKQFREMLYQDHRLLLELTLPYLTGIIAHGFSRVEGKVTQDDFQDPNDGFEIEDLGLAMAANDRAGKEMLKVFANQDTAQFGFEHSNRTAPVKRKAASQKHVDTIHMLAAKARKKISDLD